MDENKKPGSNLGRRLMVGYIVFGTLVALKAIEYAIAHFIKTGNWPYMALLAMVSAGLIAYYYKHIRQLWSAGGKENE